MSATAQDNGKATPGKPASKKSCFVIGPIGKKDSDTRVIADWLLEGIIKPVLENEPFQYEVRRADEISDPGHITDQVIEAVMESDLVIADMTGPNANAFYELAVRHMEEKPVIHMIREGQDVPFDVQDYRKVDYETQRIQDLEAAKTELASQVRAIEDPGYKPTNPIIKARGHLKLNRSADPRDKIIADLVSTMNRIKHQLDRHELMLKEGPQLPPTRPQFPDLLSLDSDDESISSILQNQIQGLIAKSFSDDPGRKDDPGRSDDPGTDDGS